MCTNTFKQYTTSRYISKLAPVHYVNRCKCGFCSECIRQIKSEWALRSYYEALSCFNKNGFCLFDTLTYRDSSLHWFSDRYSLLKGENFDFMSFSRDDIKKFFKKLRINLFRDGYSVDGNLRYLVTSEYGSELKTNRPHYHVLFFVNFDIAPELFSRYVSEAWIHGITDGICPRNHVEPWWCYKSKHYVLGQRVFRSANYDLNKLVNYVVKYITKDLYVYKKLFKRVFAAYTYIHPNWTQYYDYRAYFRRFKSSVLPFHLQSKGFGLFALESNKFDEIIDGNYLRLPFQNKGICAFIPLPMYYKRKLFYRTCYFEGKLRWLLTENGKEWKKRNLFKSIENFSYRLASWRKDIDSVGLARYHFLRRGVLVPSFMKNYDDSSLLSDFLSSSALRPLHESGDLLYNYTTPIYRFSGGAFISDRYHSQELPNNFSSWCVSPAGFVLKNPFMVSLNEPDKDNILEDFESYLSSVGDIKDIVNSQKDEQIFRYKMLGML